MVLGLLVWLAGHGAALAQPSISGFSPTVGEPGVSVTVNGFNFTGAYAVTFNGVSAIFEVVSSTQISATVPAEALSGPLSISTTAGNANSLPSQFQVAPRITDFTPARGAPGSTVLIEGANFVNGATAVQFGSITAAASVTSASQITATVPASATNGAIAVTTSAGSAVTTNEFIVTTLPFISDFSPAAAAIGTVVVINGANFSGTTSVKFFNDKSANILSVSPTQIQVTIPTGATTGPISVTTAAGTGTSTNDMITGSGPIITGFNPSIGARNQQNVLIEGINFTGASAVTFNNVNASYFVTSDTQINATVPGTATTGLIRVTRSGQTGQSLSNFVVSSGPVIVDFTPTSGPVGQNVVLSGFNFVQNNLSVKFNGVAAATPSVTAPTQAHVTVPSGATTGPITVYNSQGTNESTISFFVTGPAPAITSLVPESGPTGAQIEINGLNFGSATSVKFNGVSAGFTIVAPTQIRATVPVGASSGPVSVTSSAGTGTSTNTFYVWPRIGGFFPTNGFAGSSITITGANFTAASAVRIGGTEASFTLDSDAQITALVPTLAKSGALTVTTPAGIVATSTNFHVLPLIVDFTPASGPVDASVSIRGTGFFDVSAVQFNGVNASFQVVSLTNLTATVPNGATTGFLKVITGEGQSQSPQTFGVLPAIISFAPGSGGAGAAVVISGTTLGSVTAVLFNGVTAGFTVDSGSQLTATVPANATTGPITVTSPDGSDVSDQHFQFLPSLFVAPLPNQELLLSWPAASSDFTLEYTFSLSPANWFPAPNPTTVVGDQIRATNSTASGIQYFRLRKP
ncbi:MAG: IPT/TIG domain-containing protein [Verrucomicrobiota bacterium]